MSKSDLEIINEGGVVVVVLGEEYNNLDEAALEATSLKVLGIAGLEETRLMLFDMAQTKFFGSAFLGTLFRVWRRLTSRDGRMAVCGANEICREIFDVTQTEKLWPLYDSRATAIRELTRPR